MASTYVCKRNQNGDAESILFLATDITDKKEENVSTEDSTEKTKKQSEEKKESTPEDNKENAPQA